MMALLNPHVKRTQRGYTLGFNLQIVDTIEKAI